MKQKSSQKQQAERALSLNTAQGHHQAGRLAQAEAIYRRILERQPDHADALQLLGMAAHQQGRHAEAADL
ncbi:MAG: tetratricopeptide repeat protein, partial [Gammaproteobacteria bacterium]